MILFGRLSYNMRLMKLYSVTILFGIDEIISSIIIACGIDEIVEASCHTMPLWNYVFNVLLLVFQYSGYFYIFIASIFCFDQVMQVDQEKSW
jgi:hypothetical protein